MIDSDGLTNLLTDVSNCEKCKFWEFREKVVFAEGRSNAKVMLIGLSPGREENLTGKLFVGPSGDFLNKLLSIAKLNRETLYITNVIKCHAPTDLISQTEIDICSLYLDRQIKIVKPMVIISLGSIPTKYIFAKYNLPKKKISEIHGQVFEVTTTADLFDVKSTSENIKIITMFHPAAALRTYSLLEVVKNDWKNLSEKL